MTLPNKFKFTCTTVLHKIVYKAKLKDTYYEVSWKNCDGKPVSINYFLEEVARFVKDGTWKIQPESLKNIHKVTDKLASLINEKKDASGLTSDELKALQLTRGLINRLLDDRS